MQVCYSFWQNTDDQNKIIQEQFFFILDTILCVLQQQGQTIFWYLLIPQAR